MSELHAVANKMVKKGKGILAADESTPTCSKRFESINTESTTENRNFYRNMLFTSEDIEKFISGIILFDETFHQSELSSGVKFDGNKAEVTSKIIFGDSSETQIITNEYILGE